MTVEKAGLKVFILSDTVSLCTGDSGIKVKPDVSFYNAHAANFAGFILLGGGGARNYWDHTGLQNIAADFYKSGKIIGAVCSAPVILARSGILRNSKATCFVDDKKELLNAGVELSDNPVVISNNIITADSPISSLAFAETFIHSVINKISSPIN